MFERAHSEWSNLHAQCTRAYHEYVEFDAACDCKQAECETTNCEWDSCHFLNCEDTYNKCWGRCETEHTKTNEAKECLEKDRKIDWSATEKIECYVDVLLAKPSNETLIKHCGTDDCYNKFREDMYHKCNEMCVEVDYDSNSRRHHSRREGDIDVTDEGANSVYTKHRAFDADAEKRCTAHLDLDYQLPPCCHPCEIRPSIPCENQGSSSDHLSYMWLHYGQFGHLSQDNVPDLPNKICHSGEHTQAYAYNLCDCTECPSKPEPPTPSCTVSKKCNSGVYDYRQHDIKNSCAPGPNEADEE
jgi:hypothetical protein